MGFTDMLNLVDYSELTKEQRRELARILRKRRQELGRALKDVERGLIKLEALKEKFP